MEKKGIKEDSEDVYAAITMALYELNEEDAHDIEHTILTLKHAVASHSPWSAKFFGLREIPLRR